LLATSPRVATRDWDALREFLDLADGAAVYRHEATGHDATGGAIEVSMLIAVKVENGHLARAEMFSIADEAAARARFS
jgi:hypothetical protein